MDSPLRLLASRDCEWTWSSRCWGKTSHLESLWDGDTSAGWELECTARKESRGVEAAPVLALAVAARRAERYNAEGMFTGVSKWVSEWYTNVTQEKLWHEVWMKSNRNILAASKEESSLHGKGV
jgi:hypothetical protein